MEVRLPLSNTMMIRDFIYRMNPDSTCDSICLKCYATAATCYTADALRLGEQLHVCYVTETFREHPPAVEL
jgi:hypothetical protein